MKNFKKPLLISLGFTILIFSIHGFFSYFVDDTNIIIMLRPIRDFLFFPFLTLTGNIYEIYCWIASFGLLDYERCIQPLGKGLNMTEGPPEWFNWTIISLACLAIITYYTAITKIILNIFSSRRCKH